MTINTFFPDLTAAMMCQLDILCSKFSEPFDNENEESSSKENEEGKDPILTFAEKEKFVAQVKEAMILKQEELLEIILREKLHSYTLSPTSKKVLSVILLIIGIAAIITACALAIALTITLAGSGIGAVTLVENAAFIITSLGGINAVAIISAVGGSLGIASTVFSSFLFKRAVLHQRDIQILTSCFAKDTGG